MTDKRTNEEISAAIAKRLFGLVVESGWGLITASDGFQYRMSIKPYASDHNAAMGLVVPEMRKRGYIFYLDDDEGTVCVDFHGASWYGRKWVPYGEEPRAICLAALAALDQEQSNAG